jgi:hypothetical protein
MREGWYVIRHIGWYDNGVIASFATEAEALAYVEGYTSIVRDEYLTIERRWHKP